MRVLIRLSEIYGISLDDIVKGESVAPKVQPKRRISGVRAFIVAMAAVLVWFVATLVFMLFYFIIPTQEYAYLVFVVAPLPTAIVLTVFSALWGNRLSNAVACSCILWSCALIIHVFVWKFAPSFKEIYFVWIVAAVFEILIILWFSYRWFAARLFKKPLKK